MRRLFSSFADGPPGLGLLLLRLAAGVAFIINVLAVLESRPAIWAAALGALSAGFGVLLLVGLWTPIVAVLVAADALWHMFTSDQPWRWALMAALGAALALLGPGMWSIDARLFGWKRVEIPARKRPQPSP